MPTSKQPRPPGRPTKLDAVVAHVDRDGVQVPVTAAERIVQLIRAGNYIETAAAAAGVAKPTFHQWLRIAAEAHGKMHRRQRLTKHEQECVAFAAAVDEAQAATEAEDVGRLAQLGRGTTLVHKRIKRDAQGTVLEQVTTEEQVQPDARVLQWRLERRFRRRWGPGIEVTGADGGPIEVDATVSAREALGDVLATMAARLAQVQVVGDVIDAESTEGLPLLTATEERPGADPADL